MKVHSQLGNGFQEVIYQRAMVIEMEKKRLSFAREMEMEIQYDGIPIGTRRVDFFVEDRVMVELKSLLNFGSKSLEYRRIYNLNHPDNQNPKIQSSHQS